MGLLHTVWILDSSRRAWLHWKEGSSGPVPRQDMDLKVPFFGFLLALLRNRVQMTLTTLTSFLGMYPTQVEGRQPSVLRQRTQDQ